MSVFIKMVRIAAAQIESKKKLEYMLAAMETTENMLKAKVVLTGS